MSKKQGGDFLIIFSHFLMIWKKQMSERFDAVLAALSRQIGTELTAEDGLASLTFDGKHVVHLVPLGEVQLAIFMSAAQLVSERQALLLLQQNFFSPDPCQPRVGLSKDNNLIVWSQHELSDMDGPALNRILANLLAFAETLPVDAPPAESASFHSGLMV
ncbi:TPA: CesT family type III secretion system chaperone [Vibrio harveyi]